MAHTHWAITTLAAILGTAAMSSITRMVNAADVRGRRVFAGFVTVGIATVASSILVLLGLAANKTGLTEPVQLGSAVTCRHRRNGQDTQ